MKILESTQILMYIERLIQKHRATLGALKKEGKTYRSRDVTYEGACLNTLRDIKSTIELPQKNAELSEAMARFAEKDKPVKVERVAETGEVVVSPLDEDPLKQSIHYHSAPNYRIK